VPGTVARGAPHGSEVPYVFGTLPAGRYTAIDQRISQEMQEYWTNFAKTGSPNVGNLPRWPDFTPTGRAYLDFTDAGPVAKEGLRRAVCGVYIELLEHQMGR